MCILFFKLNEYSEFSDYRLILANNRDEYWTRPTATAAFWGKESQCLSSLDLAPGREGGTWLGMTKQGKVAILLNIVDEYVPNRKGRGFLVSNYLSSSIDAETFLHNVAEDVRTSDYNGFHLVLSDVRRDKPSPLMLSEKAGDCEKDRTIQTLSLSEVHAVGNSAVSRPWKKVVMGKSQFKKIIEDNNTVDSKTELVADLMNLLSDETQHLPDFGLETTCQRLQYSRECIQQISACRIWCPSISFGTRTNTVILVDWEGNCDYIERSVTTPIRAVDPRTNTAVFSFKLDLQSQQSASWPTLYQSG